MKLKENEELVLGIVRQGDSCVIIGDPIDFNSYELLGMATMMVNDLIKRIKDTEVQKIANRVEDGVAGI